MSEALGWPAAYLGQLLAGESPQPHASETNDPVLTALDDLTRGLEDLRERVQEIERRLSDEGDRP